MSKEIGAEDEVRCDKLAVYFRGSLNSEAVSVAKSILRQQFAEVRAQAREAAEEMGKFYTAQAEERAEAAEARLRESQETHERNDIAFDSMDQCYQAAAAVARRLEGEVRELRTALEEARDLLACESPYPACRDWDIKAAALLARTAPQERL